MSEWVSECVDEPPVVTELAQNQILHVRTISHNDLGTSQLQ